MYNLTEYSKNYRKTTGGLWNYYRDEPNDPLADNYNADPITNQHHLNTKAVLQEKQLLIGALKRLSLLHYYFWRTLTMSLIKCEVSLTLT